jgi:CheY-like chemotaxis protein
MNKSQHKIIFLIDDDSVSNFINTKIIQGDFPFAVVAFTNAMEVLQELKRHQAPGSDSIPDLIFLDINMPIMDGWEFLDEFVKLPDFLLEKCSIAMLTSSLDRDDIEKSKKYKCVVGFISKPLTVEILKDMDICVANYRSV